MRDSITFDRKLKQYQCMLRTDATENWEAISDNSQITLYPKAADLETVLSLVHGSSETSGKGVRASTSAWSNAYAQTPNNSDPRRAIDQSLTKTWNKLRPKKNHQNHGCSPSRQGQGWMHT